MFKNKMEYIENFLNSIYYYFYPETPINFKINLQDTNINDTEINNLIEEVKYEIQIEKDFKLLEKRYELLLEHDETVECINNTDDNDNNDNNNIGAIPVLC